MEIGFQVENAHRDFELKKPRVSAEFSFTNNRPIPDSCK
jgi:hypothetical protein